MYELLRRLRLGLLPGTWTSTAMPDHESRAYIDGAELTEMDCRWSPTMGVPQATFEETQPWAQLQRPTSG